MKHLGLYLQSALNSEIDLEIDVRVLRNTALNQKISRSHRGGTASDCERDAFGF